MRAIVIALAFFSLAPSIHGDAYINLANRVSTTIDVPFRDPGGNRLDSHYRASLVLIDEFGRRTALTPSTTFRTGAALGYFVPVIVPVNNKAPGDKAQVQVIVSVGDKIFGRSWPLEVTLGTLENPGLLLGLSQDSPLTQFWGVGLKRDWASESPTIRPIKATFLALGNDRIFLGGSSLAVNGIDYGPLVAFTPSVELVANFSPALARDDSVLVGLIDSNSSLLLGIRSEVGAFRLVRLLPTGARDATFTEVSLQSAPTALAVLNDGRLVVATTGAALQFYTSTGLAVGPPLQIVGSETPSINTIEPDSTGGFFFGGSFENVNGLARTNLARIISDGHADATFLLDRSVGIVLDLEHIAQNRTQVVAFGPFGPQSFNFAVPSDNQSATASSSENAYWDNLILDDAFLGFEFDDIWSDPPRGFLIRVIRHSPDSYQIVDQRIALLAGKVSSAVYLLEETADTFQLARYTSATQPWRTELYPPQFNGRGFILNFKCDLRGPNFVVESSTDFLSWSPHLGNIFDSNTNQPQKFYRLRYP